MVNKHAYPFLLIGENAVLLACCWLLALVLIPALGKTEPPTPVG